jgi:hypothetical protein
MRMAFFDSLSAALKRELRDGAWRPGASPEAIQDAASRLGLTFPEDYVAFLLESNGGSFHIGSSYVVLSPVEELVQLDERHAMSTRVPELRLLGTNAAWDGFALDLRQQPHSFVVVPLAEPRLEDTLHQGTRFVDLLERLRTGQHLEPAPR